MADMMEYKCPSCGGAMEFDSTTQKMKCPYCDTEMEVAQYQQMQEKAEGNAGGNQSGDAGGNNENWSDMGSNQWMEGETDGIRVYVCQSCGGEIVADANTGATSCPFCGNRVVMKGQFAGDLKPDYIIPFKKDKKAAKAAYFNHLKGKKYLPKVFKKENFKSLVIAVLAGMIILLVALSVVNLQILTATEPDSPAAVPGLQRALLWISVIGGVCIFASIILLAWLPRSISKPIQELTRGILEIANHNYEKRLELNSSEEFSEVSKNFNRMAKRLEDYHASTLSDMMASKKYMETIINSINEPIIGLNNDMEILFINDEALNVINLKREEVIKHSAQDISLRNDLLRRLIRELVEIPGEPVKDKEKEKKEPLKIYADNKESFFQVKYMSISQPGKDGVTMEKKGYVIMLKNITEFKELDSAKTTFISTISHELKTPISAIMMSLQLLEDQRIGALNEEQEDLANSIKENSERLLNITGELLNMTQVESGKLQLKPKITKPIELIEYAIKANRVQAEKFNIQIEVEYPEDKIGKLFVDSEKIAWVLTNLLSNAIRYSPENGRVVIGARQTDDGFIEMFVRDFGKGIDPRYHKSIFDHYFRVPGTKVQGSGLGLSISRDFVEAHNGTLTVDSKLGEGSTFVMRLKA